MPPTAAEVLGAVHSDCDKRERQCLCVHGCVNVVACGCFSSLCTECHIDSMRGCDHVPECDAPASGAYA